MAAPLYQTLHGKLELEFAKHRGKTRLMSDYQTPPLRSSRVLYMNGDDEATVYLVDTSGGMASGDRNDITVTASASSTVHLITQSSTKIYPARLNDEASIQTIRLLLSDHSQLYWHTETTIPFANARFKQSIDVSLDQTSIFYYADILSPGREKHHETFHYDYVDQRISIRYAGKRLAYDRLIFKPSAVAVNCLGMMDDFLYYGSAWFCSPSFNLPVSSIQKELQPNKDLRFAITSLDPIGIHARWLSRDLCLLKEKMARFYELAVKENE